MGEVRARNILLRGRFGVGKTTVLQKLMALLPRVRFGGFFGRHMQPLGMGRQLVLVEGKHRELADQALERPAPLAGYTIFDARSLEAQGLPCLERALREAQVAVVDEIGPEEASSPAFVDLVRHAFDASIPVLAAGRAEPVPFLEELATRPDTRTWEVEPSNRATLAEELADALMEILGDARDGDPAEEG